VAIALQLAYYYENVPDSPHTNNIFARSVSQLVHVTFAGAAGASEKNFRVFGVNPPKLANFGLGKRFITYC